MPLKPSGSLTWINMFPGNCHETAKDLPTVVCQTTIIYLRVGLKNCFQGKIILRTTAEGILLIALVAKTAEFLKLSRYPEICQMSKFSFTSPYHQNPPEKQIADFF